MIETAEGDHSNNMDELLDYLYREMDSRNSLAVANVRNPERSKREQDMSTHYRRMYEAARFYRTNFKEQANHPNSTS